MFGFPKYFQILSRITGLTDASLQHLTEVDRVDAVVSSKKGKVSEEFILKPSTYVKENTVEVEHGVVLIKAASTPKAVSSIQPSTEILGVTLCMLPVEDEVRNAKSVDN